MYSHGPQHMAEQKLCEDTGCIPEDLPEAMNIRETWQEGQGYPCLWHDMMMMMMMNILARRALMICCHSTFDVQIKINSDALCNNGFSFSVVQTVITNKKNGI